MSGLLNIEEFNKEVMERAITILTLLAVEDAHKGVRFRLVGDCENINELPLVAEGIWCSKNSPLFAHEDKGFLLSFWLSERELHPARLTHTFCRLLLRTYLRGFGNRHCTKVKGFNLYIGCHGSQMASATPTTPKEHIADSQYYRQHYRDLARPFVEKVIRKLGYTAALFGSVGDPLYQFISFDNELSPCRVALVTGGASVGTQKGDRVIGFCNTPHVDRTDKISDGRQERLQERITLGQQLIKEHPEVDASLLNYAEKFGKVIGFQVPTTCGYQWITKNDKAIEFYCYFLSIGLRSAVRIVDGIGHQMYAGSFGHHTSACLAIVTGKVVLVDQEGSMNLFAWGKGSKRR